LRPADVGTPLLKAAGTTLVAGPAVAPRPERRREFIPNATLAERDDLTPLVARYVVRPDAAVPSFEPGQYFSLGFEIGDRLVLRPYSTASPRGATQALEFLIRRVPNGTLTPELWRGSVGDRLWIGPPKGLFMLKPNDTRTHLLVSSGTGIAPFMSMLGELLSGVADGDASRRAALTGPRVVVAHGVSYESELSYRQRLQSLAARSPRLTYVPTLSRPDDPENAGWVGRSGRVETILAGICEDLSLDPADTVAYLCGNPDMVARSWEALRDRGFAAEAVVHENYWTTAAV
jgi:ferredoxin/flavodoxin---NADP+ reductase